MGGPSAADRTIYVGNLPYDATQAEVEALFSGSNAGPVVRVSLPMDEEGRKRGFGFVTMASAEVANAAIEALRGADLRGRSLIVNLARPKGEGGGGGGGFGGPSSSSFSGGGSFGGPSSFRPSGGSGGPETGGGGGPPASRGRKQYDKRRNAEAEGPRKKAWDRERGGGGGRVDIDDWGDD
jgi:RNA recognition motif-containing protein